MDEGGTWRGGRPQPRRLCVRWGPRSPLPKKGGDFRPIFIDVFCHPQLELAMVNLCSLPNLVEFLSLRVTKTGTATQNLENWVV